MGWGRGPEDVSLLLSHHLEGLVHGESGSHEGIEPLLCGLHLLDSPLDSIDKATVKKTLGGGLLDPLEEDAVHCRPEVEPVDKREEDKLCDDADDHDAGLGGDVCPILGHDGLVDHKQYDGAEDSCSDNCKDWLSPEHFLRDLSIDLIVDFSLELGLLLLDELALLVCDELALDDNKGHQNGDGCDDAECDLCVGNVLEHFNHESVTEAQDDLQSDQLDRPLQHHARYMQDQLGPINFG